MGWKIKIQRQRRSSSISSKIKKKNFEYIHIVKMPKSLLATLKNGLIYVQERQ